MKHRSFITVALAATPFVAGMAQVSSPPPVQPAAPVVAPATVSIPSTLINGQALDEIRRAADDARRIGEQSWAIGEQNWMIADEARRSANLAVQDIRAALPFEYDTHSFMNFGSRDVGPRPAWMQGDPADSAYRTARETMNRYEYAKAAAQFKDLTAKYPNSRYAPDSYYWEAFARYRVGTLDDLHQALKALDAVTPRLDYSSKKSDVPQLKVRILGALSLRGEAGADDELKKVYQQYPNVCDDESMQVRSSVLNSLFRSDPDGTMPQVKKILMTRDVCQAPLRKTAVYLLADKPDDASAALITQVVKSDTVRDVRRQAVEALAKMPSDAAIATLQDLMKDQDDQIQSAAVHALMRSPNSKARVAMRSLIDRKESPERQRTDAITSFDRDNTTADDAAYLRGLYTRDTSTRIRDAIISALSRTGTDDNVTFLVGIAKNPNESSSLRSSALTRIGRMNISIDDLIKIYDASDSRRMRQSIVAALGSRKEDGAVTKLLDIVKFSTDPEVKNSAVETLLRKKDLEINKKLAIILGGA